VALNQQVNIHFSVERGMRIMNLLQVFCVCKGIISEVKKGKCFLGIKYHTTERSLV
jgi:hypothetical protein